MRIKLLKWEEVAELDEQVAEWHCPWASHFFDTLDGIWCFESYEDYKQFVKGE